MAEPKPPEPVTLIAGMLARRADLFDATEARLAEHYGPIDLVSPVIDFDFTDYYEQEMGRSLKRKFVSFREQIDPSAIADIKLRTNELERELAALDPAVPRPVNIDPGYVCGSKLVLASTKNRSQRIYLGKGVYAEITLECRKGRLWPAAMTYADYASPRYLAFFEQVRERHLKRAP